MDISKQFSDSLALLYKKNFVVATVMVQSFIKTIEKY